MEIQLWRSILCPYELAVKELTVKFEHMIEEYRENDRYSPIEQVSGRVKSVSSILEKLQRKHIPIEKMETEVEDLAGVRIICQFEEDIDTVAAIIRRRTDMEVKSEKNYLTHIKQSGYRSYHMILYYTVETINGPKRLQVEVQIRTMAMNFWATIEHSCGYLKPRICVSWRDSTGSWISLRKVTVHRPCITAYSERHGRVCFTDLKEDQYTYIRGIINAGFFTGYKGRYEVKRLGRSGFCLCNG